MPIRSAPGPPNRTRTPEVPRLSSWAAAILPGLAATLVAGPGPAGAAAQVVEGRLLESGSERPVKLARMALTDTAYTVLVSTLTDDEGRFRLEAPEPGSYYVVADRVGYHSAVDGILELGPGGYVEITFYVRPQAIDLEGIVARAERRRIQRRLEGVGYYRREAAGFGHFISPEEIERRNPFSTLDLFRGIPNFRVLDGGIFGESLSCNRIWVDGIRMGFLEGPVLEEVVAIQDIAAVEVYTRASSLPLMFGGTSSSGRTASCAVVVWTKVGG